MRFFILAILSAYASLAEKAAQTHLTDKYPSYHWPFSGMLKERLTQESSESVWIFSYGSLLEFESAARTLHPDSLAEAKPAIAFGIRRIFNRDMAPGQFEERYGPRKSPGARAMLNVEPADPTSMVNGLLIQVPFDDLQELCKREIGYDLIPVIVVLWDERRAPHPHFRVAYTFSAPRGIKRDGRPLVSNRITPVPGYARLVEEGAASHGPLFLQFYRETTYQADGQLI